MSLPPLVRFLDPRTPSEAAELPVRDSVNIPLAQLLGRIHEIGGKSETVRVVGPRELASAAIQVLEESGRQAVHQFEFDWGDSGPGRLWRPTQFLEGNLARLPSVGTGLDLGCGSGRDAVALAAHGFRVVAADLLCDALERGADLAKRYLLSSGAQVEWVQADLERTLPFAPESFDLVTLFRFLPREVLPDIPRLLQPSGSLLLETFTPAHKQKYGRPSSPSRLLGPTEALTLFPGLRVRHQSYAWRENGTHTARLWAVKE